MLSMAVAIQAIQATCPDKFAYRAQSIPVNCSYKLIAISIINVFGVFEGRGKGYFREETLESFDAN